MKKIVLDDEIMDKLSFIEIEPDNSATNNINTHFNVQFGKLYPPSQQIKLFSPEEWEEFTLEWAFSQKDQYISVVRESGGNDMGIDVAGFTDENGTNGQWDNFQCKHYKNALTPSDIFVEFGKMIWHSFLGKFTPPRKYYFIAPQGCGIKLSKLLRDPQKLKEEVRLNWEKYCQRKITDTLEIKLEGELEAYFNSFDFSIFGTKEALELIEDHKKTKFHAVRFGGGLNQRPQPVSPPSNISDDETNYIKKLLSVYQEQTGQGVLTIENLISFSNWTKHFNKQREFFYCAESLKNFSRDNVPNGTFEELQREILDGVFNLTFGNYPRKLDKLHAILNQATSLNLTSNALISVVRTSDKSGICHQLANIDELDW